MEELIVQDCSPHKLVANAVLEAAVDLGAAAVGVENLEHLYLPVPVHIELRHSAVQSHQNAARLLERAHEAAYQLVGDAFCECLKVKGKQIQSVNPVLYLWFGFFQRRSCR